MSKVYFLKDFVVNSMKVANFVWGQQPQLSTLRYLLNSQMKMYECYQCRVLKRFRKIPVIQKNTGANVDCICLQPNGRSEAPDPDAFDLEEELNQCLGFGTLWSSPRPMISRKTSFFLRLIGLKDVKESIRHTRNFIEVQPGNPRPTRDLKNSFGKGFHFKPFPRASMGLVYLSTFTR